MMRYLIPRSRKDRSLLWGGDPFSSLDRIFEGWLQNAGYDPESGSLQGVDYVPYLDVINDDKEIRVEAELPGLSEKDVDVSIHNDVLTIQGEKKVDAEKKDKHYYRSERTYGAFRRDIQLSPEMLDTGKIAASFKNGVLTVTIPKKEIKEEKAKKIEIKAE